MRKITDMLVLYVLCAVLESACGITNMRQRVETFGGTIDIRTENGYRIFIHIPKADIPAGR